MKDKSSFLLLLLIFSCRSSVTTPETVKESGRSFKEFRSSFESVADFSGFYITPQNHLGTTSHGRSSEEVFRGQYSHKAWITGANPPSKPGVNNNHRGYPTVQLHKSLMGVFRCPCRISLYAWVDAPISSGEWLSFATFTGDTSDNWNRTVLVNLSDEGFVHLMHVPNQGEGTRTFQTSDIVFPQRRWVHLEIYLDLDPARGHAKVYQDGKLVSRADVRGFNGSLAQAHFGMYAAPSIASGTIYNDELVIQEVEGIP